MKRKLAGLFAALLLLSSGSPGALAASQSFRDLPSTHWAYAEITRAVSHGIMNGLGDGTMNPDGTLTWAHYLAMISRTFAPMAYEGARSAGTDWKTAGYQVAIARGYLLQNDFLPVSLSTLNEPISRQDVAVLLSRVLPAQSASGVSSGGGYWYASARVDTDDTSRPLSQAIVDVIIGDTIRENLEAGKNTIAVEVRPSGQDWSPIVKQGSANFTVRGSSTSDSGETTAPTYYDNGETTAPNVYDNGDTTAPNYYDGGDTTAPNTSGSSGSASYTPPAPVTTPDPPLSDFAQLDSGHQAAVRRLYDLGIVRGKSDGTFGGTDTVRRCDGAVLLMRTVDAVDTLRAGEVVALTFDLVDGDGKSVGQSIEANARIGDRLSELAAVYAPTGYKIAPQDGQVSAIQSRYALKFAPLTQAEREEIEATAQYRQGQISYEEYMAKDFWLKKLGDNPRKRLLIFGNEYQEEVTVTETPELPEGMEGMEGVELPEPIQTTQTVTRTEIEYNSPEECQTHMASVEVPVWKLRGQQKSPGTLRLTVNAALAEEVTAIFTEIYNDPEQFPISDGGGYSWRTNSRSEHIQGTAIDLNVDSNYQVRDGGAMVGDHWTPGEDPYSITPGGSVVRIFAEHGWDWGGNAWAGHSDPSYGYHDYMHFSYFGR